jgi:hypothetical protein
MNGSTKNYKFGPKNNWRRTMWNKIKERLLMRPENAVVLYMAGRDDLDRDVAISKGFKHHNLIAVEKDAEVVKILRRQGKLAIHANLIDVLAAWQNLQIGVVFADICCGITPSTIELLYSFFQNPDLSDSVVAVNLLKGRDSYSNHLRQFIGESHRGRAFFDTHTRLADEYALSVGRPLNAAELYQPRFTLPFYSEYVSPPQVFNSAVYRNVSSVNFIKLHWIRERIGSETLWEFLCRRFHEETNGGEQKIHRWHDQPLIAHPKADGCETLNDLEKLTRKESVARQVAAIKAHRTRILQTH